jgi:CheY-like chemotaxis protein
MISLPFFHPPLSELLLRDLLANAHDAVVGETPDGTVIAVNARFLALIGWTGDYNGEPLDTLIAHWVSTSAHPQVVEAYFASCRAPEPPESTLELKPNPGHVVEAQFRALTLPGGSEIRLWYFHEWRTSALAWVGHEIKNPLNAVLGFSELLAESMAAGEKNEAALESLRGLRIGARHLQSVLGDLLDLSRLESGVVEAHPEWTPLDGFLSDLGDLFKARFRRRGLEFVISAPPGPPVEVWIDPGRLNQILSNLLLNSLRFTKRGWVALKVTLKGSTWEFSVEDSGVGIPLDQQRTIFEPFVQVQGQSERKLGGSGLGLAICRALAQSLGGRLSLESEPGAGSRFVIGFDSLDSRPLKPKSDLSGTPSMAGATVLVADDERTSHLLVQRFLRGAAVNLISAFDGAQAVELWKVHRPRVVLLDLRMPQLSGLEAARRIRALDPQGQTRLLAMSASRPTAVELADGKNLWSGFLEKPFNGPELLKFLSKHLTFVDESSTSP